MFALTSELIPSLIKQRAARRTVGIAVISTVLLLAGCAVVPVPSAKNASAEEVAKQQRLERAQNNLADGLKRNE